MDKTLFLADVLKAKTRIRPYAVYTPLRKSSWLSEVTGADIHLKLENLQVTGSFKYRGALNALAWAKDNGIGKIFTASAGNHGLGVAEAALHTHLEATVCVPTNAAATKKKKLKEYAVGLIEHGTDCEVTEAFARRMATEKKGYYVSPYNNFEVVAGQGTVGLEMLQAMPTLDTIIVAVGGGGLIAGVATAAKAINPKIRVIGAVAANCPSMQGCINAGRIVNVIQSPTIADGIAGNIEPESITFPMCRELVDDWIAVEEQEMTHTIFEFLENEGMLIEGAAACAVACLARKVYICKPKEKVGVIVCGGNISRQQWREIIVDQLVGAKKGAE